MDVNLQHYFDKCSLEQLFEKYELAIRHRHYCPCDCQCFDGEELRFTSNDVKQHILEIYKEKNII